MSTGRCCESRSNVHIDFRLNWNCVAQMSTNVVAQMPSVNLFFRSNIHRPTWQDWVLNQVLPQKLILVLLLEILQVKKPEKLISINNYIYYIYIYIYIFQVNIKILKNIIIKSLKIYFTLKEIHGECDLRYFFIFCLHPTKLFYIQMLPQWDHF